MTNCDWVGLTEQVECGTRSYNKRAEQRKGNKRAEHRPNKGKENKGAEIWPNKGKGKKV